MWSRRGKSRTRDRFSFLGLQKSLWTVTGAMKLKDACSLEGKYGKLRQQLKGRVIILLTKVHLIKVVIFPVVICRCESWTLQSNFFTEDWAPKNWCFRTVVLEKTLESPLDCKEIKPVNPKGNQPWIFTGTTDAEAEAPIPQPPDAKRRLFRRDPDAGNDWRQEEKGVAKDEMVR